eukprot:844920-Prorocentrum_minimum.AAC.1
MARPWSRGHATCHPLNTPRVPPGARVPLGKRSRVPEAAPVEGADGGARLMHVLHGDEAVAL